MRKMKNIKKMSIINRSLMQITGILRGKGGFGMNELLGIAAALILAAFIIIPQLQVFAKSVMTALNTWWSGQVTAEIFPAASSF